MLDKLSQIGSKGAAMTKLAVIQQRIKNKKMVHEEGNVKVTVTGEGKLKEIRIDDEEQKELTEIIGRAIEEAQKWSMEEMKGVMGDLSKILGQ